MKSRTELDSTPLYTQTVHVCVFLNQSYIFMPFPLEEQQVLCDLKLDWGKAWWFCSDLGIWCHDGKKR